jgi:hypothetical protein
MHTNRFVLLAACAGAVALSACDTARTIDDSGGGGTLCASCHEFPPAAPAHTTSTECVLCHDTTVDADNNILPGGTHENGTADMTFAGHPGYPGGHTADALAGIGTCQSCHGTDLTFACDACHQSAGWNAGALVDNCSFCHGTPTRGGLDFATDPELAAPPEGVAGATAATDPTVGAHQAHLVGGTYSTPIACAQCHAVPADLAHLDGSATLTWGNLATADGAIPTFATGQNCTNYCHGSTLDGGGNKSPSFTETDLGATALERCSACHGSVSSDSLRAPATGRHVSNHATFRCFRCHGEVAADVANTAPALLPDRSFHLNGAKNVQFRNSDGTLDTDATWNGTTCTNVCHGTETW